MDTTLDFRLDYDLIPKQYRLGKSSSDIITAYRGDTVGLEEGIFSKALIEKRFDVIEKARGIIQSGDEDTIDTLIDKHTSHSYNSPLLSTSYNPQMAQAFAVKPDTTIYQLEISADRIIFDYNNRGRTNASGEVFVLGAILPSEIKAVKIINDDNYSELLFGHWLKRLPDKTCTNRTVKDPSNWRQVG